MRILVVYFSRSGKTEKVALALASALGADTEAIVDHAQRRGIVGYLRSAYEATFGHVVTIAPAQHDPWGYDLVIVGTPIWNQCLSSPVHSYLERHEFHRIAFFCTCGGRGSEHVFAQMQEAAGCAPVATLVLRERDAVQPLIDLFAAELRRAMPRADVASLPPVREPDRDRAI
jgi:flavodoxin